MLTCFISADSYLHLHHMDGVPAPFDLLRSIPSLLDENNSSKAMIQVPEVHGGHAPLKVPQNTQISKVTKGYTDHLLNTHDIASLVLTGLCTGQRHCWLQPRVSSGEQMALHRLQ